MTKSKMATIGVWFFIAGLIIGALGWIANESTKAGAAKWGTPTIIIGVACIVVGLTAMAKSNSRK